MIVKFFNNDSDSWEWVDNCVVRTSRIRTLEVVAMTTVETSTGKLYGFNPHEQKGVIPYNWFHYHAGKVNGSIITYYFTMRDQNNKEYTNDKRTQVRLYDELFDNKQVNDIVYAHTLEIRDNKDPSVLKYTYIYAEPAGQSTWYIMNDTGHTIERLT